MLRTALPAVILLLASPAVAQDEHVGHEAELNIVENLRRGVLGSAAIMMEASGTSWQPMALEAHDVSSGHHGGLVWGAPGGWEVGGHIMLNGVYDWQGGPRGDEKAFVAGMIMGSARRDFASGTLNLRAMLSPDPAMGAEGYPLLFAAGETADGVETLVDRQHPHDLFMELSASYAHRLGASDSVFALCRACRASPLTGRRLSCTGCRRRIRPRRRSRTIGSNSTHITFGVLTAGWVRENWKFEASRFRGREPDEHRTDIETGSLDSTAARVSWNPSENWALQVSWADIAQPRSA